MNFPRIRLDVIPIEFYCPHCETLIETDKGNENKPIPTVCPSCKKDIDTTGVQIYTGPLKK